MFSKKYMFPILAFAVPLLLRAIPEILMGPYVVGFDTMAHYVPTTVLWLHGGVDLWRYIATAPLFYTIIVSLVSVGGPVITVLKIIPPILHGFLGLSIYGYAKSGLNWSPKKSVLTALIATLYFVALRISWDLLRNELALVFFFVVLTLIAKENLGKNSWKRFLLLSLAMLAVVLAHQLVAVVMLGMITFTILFYLFRKQRAKILPLVAVSLPAVLLFFVSFYFSPSVPEFRLIFGFPAVGGDGWLSLFGFASYPAMLASEAGFFLYCFLLILPLVVVSLRRFGNFQMRAWILLMLLASLVPMVSPSNLRWIMMLTYPFAFYVSETLSRLKSINWRRFKITVRRVAVVYLVASTALLSLGFMVMSPDNPFPYFQAGAFNGYIYQIPSSMLQNTVSITDCKDVANAVQWFKNGENTNALLLTHRAFYGWALTTLDPNQVVLYEYDDPAKTAATVVQEGHSQIYLIWWINGLGWYGQPSVSSSFEMVYQSGRIAVYHYIG
jgi:hypothetical protein